jgi:hypothetical protein
VIKLSASAKLKTNTGLSHFLSYKIAKFINRQSKSLTGTVLCIQLGMLHAHMMQWRLSKRLIATLIMLVSKGLNLYTILS